MRSSRLVFAALVALVVGLGVPSLQQKVAAAPVSVTGSFGVIYGDPQPGSKLPSRTHYTLSNDAGSWTLSLSDFVLSVGGGARALNGKTVEVTGDEVSPGKIVVESISLAGGAAALAESALSAEAIVSGSKAYATLLCRFNDIATEQQPVGFFTTLMGTTKPGLNHYWREVSYENINLDGSAEYNWETMASARAAYFDADGNADLGKLATDCRAAHPAVVLGPFYGVNYVFNANLDCCAWGGNDGSKPATWMPPWAWTGRVFGHESGHSIGLDHSADQYGNVYGNRWDVMGSGLQTHVNAFHKDVEGWIPAGEIYNASGALNQQIRLVNLALPPDDLGESLSDYMMVKIPAGGDDYYTLEARKKTGYDSSPGGIPFEGVVIHLIDPTEDSSSLTPGATSEIIDGTNNGNSADDGAAWVPGELFVDEARGISVAIISEYDDGWVVAINPNTDVTVSKTATPNPAMAGELLTYNITVSNLGPGPATGVVVKDTLPNFTTYDENTLGPGACTAVAQVVTCTLPGTLAANTSKTFGITVKVSPSIPLTNGTTTITNTVNVVAAQDDDPTSTNNNFSLTTLVVSKADLVLTKECKPDQPNTQPAGTPTFCEIYVDNVGPSDAQSVVITDRIINSMPVTITGITSTTTSGAPATCPVPPINSPSGVTITCNDIVLPAGARDTIRITFSADTAGDVDDTASVSSSTPDPDSGNNTATGRVSFRGEADLGLNKTVASTVVAGTNLTYTLSVTNAGPSPATNVVLTDALPGQVSFVSAVPSQGSCQAGVVPGDPTKPLKCNLGTIASGAPAATLSVVVKVNSDVPAGTVLVNNADVASSVTDPNNANNTKSVSTTVATSADLAIVKTSDSATYKPSTVVTYSINVMNNGPSKSLNVVVTDNLPDLKAAIYQSDTGGCVLSTPKTLTCNLGDMAVGQSKTFFVYVLIKGNKGLVSNTASVGSATADPVAANNSSTKDVTIGK